MPMDQNVDEDGVAYLLKSPIYLPHQLEISSWPIPFTLLSLQGKELGAQIVKCTVVHASVVGDSIPRFGCTEALFSPEARRQVQAIRLGQTVEVSRVKNSRDEQIEWKE